MFVDAWRKAHWNDVEDDALLRSLFHKNEYNVHKKIRKFLRVGVNSYPLFVDNIGVKLILNL